MHKGSFTGSFLVCVFVTCVTFASEETPVKVTVTPDIITLKPLLSYGGCELRLRGTKGTFLNRFFQSGNIPFIEPLDDSGDVLPDGFYRFEMRLLPQSEAGKRTEAVHFAGGFQVQSGKLAALQKGSDLKNQLEAVQIYPWEGGQLGLGVATPDPAAQLHIQTGGSPRIRLEHRGLARDRGYWWDMLTDDQGFHLKNAMQEGETTPFFIASGAPEASLYVTKQGRVGLGTQEPKATLHLEASDSGDLVVIRNVANKSKRRNVLTLENRGEVAFKMVKMPSGDIWSFLVRDKDFLISRNGSRAEELRITEDGTLYTHGSINPKSDAASKTNFQEVDGGQVLQAIASMPIQSWSYKNDSQQTRHLGPTSQAFRKAFALGSDDGSISVVDSNGVALLAIKELEQRLKAKDSQLAKLKAQNDALESRLANLESRITEALANR